MTAKNCYILG